MVSNEMADITYLWLNTGLDFDEYLSTFSTTDYDFDVFIKNQYPEVITWKWEGNFAIRFYFSNEESKTWFILKNNII